MRLGIDLQACLTDSRYRGIGRYANNLVAEMAKRALGDDLVIALDASDTVRLRDARADLRREMVRAKTAVCDYPSLSFTDHDDAFTDAAGRVRGRFYEGLDLDVFLHTSHFETGSNFTTHVSWTADSHTPTAVIAYDIIPLLYPERYLPKGHFISEWYPKKCEEFARYDCFLAISEATRKDLIDHLGIDPAKIHNIGAGLDPAILALSKKSALDSSSSLEDLNIDAPFVLMVSNGDWRKNTLGAVHAFAGLPKSLQRKYLLVLTQVGSDVKEALAGPMSHLADRVRILGRVDDVTLSVLYRECRVFFFPSVYEGFGLPVLEAMAFGAPVICSDSGSLPEVVPNQRFLFKVDDEAGMVSMLESALEDDGFRESLRKGVQEHAWSFTWQGPASAAWSALRGLAGDVVSSSSDSREERTDAASSIGRVMVGQDDIKAWAMVVSRNPESAGPIERGLTAAASRGARRILVDITEVVRLDARSGIQRVVRNYCAGLYALGTEQGVEVMPIRWTEHGIVYASLYAQERLGLSIFAENDGERVVAKPNDLVFMLDSSWWMPERFDDFHAQIHAAGGEVVWMVYDLIPLLVPETCDPDVLPAFSGWLQHAAHTTDGFICISEATRLDLEKFLDQHVPTAAVRPWTRAMHLGSDLESGKVDGILSQAVVEMLETVAGTTTVLGVGTVEPRKDYQTVLDAFELLWAEGLDPALVIVGKLGWNVHELANRLRSHPQAGRRLFWLEGLSDTDLQALVERADALVQASIAEGFGLPVVEAGSKGKPLILSDIPVFHEIAGAEATYFPAGNAPALATVLAKGMSGSGWPKPANIATLTWRQSSEGIMDKMLF